MKGSKELTEYLTKDIQARQIDFESRIRALEKVNKDRG